MAWFRRDRSPALVEQRAPKAATQALRWTTPGRATPPDWDAAQAFQYGYYANPVVATCVNFLADIVAQLPFRAGVDPNRPTEYDPNAPLARFLGPPPGSPNPSLSARGLWAWTVMQRIVTGRYGWELETAPGSDEVVALWPLVSAALIPIPSAGGVRYFDGFEYGRRDRPRKIMPDHIVYGWKPNGRDFRQPESELEAAHLDISIAVAQSRYDYAFLRNDSRPASLIITEEFEDEDSARAFQQQWTANHGGPLNAGKPAFLEASGANDKGVSGAVDVKVLGASAKDTQAAQRYMDRLHQIAIALRVPWSFLESADRTFSNADQESVNFWQNRMLPLLADLQDDINIQLAPRLGREVGWFDTSNVMALKERMEPVTQKVGVDVLVAAGLMTKNEGRAEYGLPPVDGGDEFVEEPATVPVEDPGPAEVEEDRKVRGGPPGPAPLPSAESRVDPDSITAETRRARIADAHDKALVKLERKAERVWRRTFARQRQSVLVRLNSNRGRRAVAGKEQRAPADDVFDPSFWNAELLKPKDDGTPSEMHDLYEDIVAAGGERAAARFDLAFDVEAPYAQDFIQARTNQIVGLENENTYKAIKNQLAEGAAAGESIPDLSKRVETVFETASTSRAAMIARTEVNSAFNGSASLTAAQYPADVAAGQEWIATRDGKVRDTHRIADGQAVPIGVPFSVGSSALAYPGDPAGSAAEVVNCRCTLAILTPDEMKARGIIRAVARTVTVRVPDSVLQLVRPQEVNAA